MNIIVGFGKHLYIFEGKVTKAAVRHAGSTEQDIEDEEEVFDQVPVDPHGTNGAHMELSPSVIYEGAKARRFGFGSEEASR